MKWFITFTVLMLASCSPSLGPETPPVVIQNQPIERPSLTLPEVDTYQARDVDWIVVTPENAERVFQDLEEQGKSPALFSVTEQGYENISLNNRDALRVIMQQKAVIRGYRQYYIRVDKNISDHNSNQ